MQRGGELCVLKEPASHCFMRETVIKNRVNRVNQKKVLLFWSATLPLLLQFVIFVCPQIIKEVYARFVWIAKRVFFFLNTRIRIKLPHYGLSHLYEQSSEKPGCDSENRFSERCFNSPISMFEVAECPKVHKGDVTCHKRRVKRKLPWDIAQKHRIQSHYLVFRQKAAHNTSGIMEWLPAYQKNRQYFCQYMNT